MPSPPPSTSESRASEQALQPKTWAQQIEEQERALTAAREQSRVLIEKSRETMKKAQEARTMLEQFVKKYLDNGADEKEDTGTSNLTGVFAVVDKHIGGSMDGSIKKEELGKSDAIVSAFEKGRKI